MRILVLSDLHREIWCRPHTRSAADEAYWPFDKIDLAISRPDVVVLAGDIDVGARAISWADETFPDLPVIYVHGNHEGYGHQLDVVRAEITAACQTTGHVHHLDRGELIMDGVRFLGAALWTDFRLYGADAVERAWHAAAMLMNDYRQIRLASGDDRTLTPDDTIGWHRADRDWVAERLTQPFEGKTVVVTHMAPSERSIAEPFKGDRLSPAFASNVEHLVEMADLWIHGHVHNACDYRIGDKGRVVCNPLGYPGRFIGEPPENQGFNPSLVIDLESLD